MGFCKNYGLIDKKIGNPEKLEEILGEINRTKLSNMNDYMFSSVDNIH